MAQGIWHHLPYRRLFWCKFHSGSSLHTSVENHWHLARPPSSVRSQGPRAHFSIPHALSQNFGRKLYLRSHRWRVRRDYRGRKCVNFCDDDILARTCLSRGRPSPSTQDPQSCVLLYQSAGILKLYSSGAAIK